MKIALINDTHAGARGDDPRFNEFFFKFWEGTFFPYLKKITLNTSAISVMWLTAESLFHL
jgi:hypothetical protein